MEMECDLWIAAAAAAACARAFAYFRVRVRVVWTRGEGKTRRAFPFAGLGQPANAGNKVRATPRGRERR